jgi:site-specific DNA recombinase
LAVEVAATEMTPRASRAAAPASDDGGLAAWAQRTGRRPGDPGRGRLRFAFYGRVSTEDWQDPVTSRTRQQEQAAALVAGRGAVVAEFFDVGESRTLAWGRRPQASALVAALADPDRGWDAIVIGEYERAFYGSQHRRSGSRQRCPLHRLPYWDR